MKIMCPQPKVYLEADDGISGLIRDGGGIFACEMVSQSGVSRQGSARREGEVGGCDYQPELAVVVSRICTRKADGGKSQRNKQRRRG